MIYLTLASKGGIGKTPLTLELAQQFGSNGKKTAVIDLDLSTQTAQSIARLAKANSKPVHFDIIAKPTKGYDVTLIDTPAAFANFTGLNEDQKSFVLRILRMSDRILCPISPELAHLTAFNETLDDLFFRIDNPVSKAKITPVSLKTRNDSDTKTLQTIAISRGLDPLPYGLPKCEALASHHGIGELVAGRLFNGTKDFASALSQIAESLQA